MYCPNCGEKIPDDSSFCSNCGAKIETQDVQSNASQNTSNQMAAPDEPKNTSNSNKEAKNDKKKKGNPIIRIISIIVGVIILVVLFIAFTGGFDDEVAELTGGRMADHTTKLYQDEEGVYRRLEDEETSTELINEEEIDTTANTENITNSDIDMEYIKEFLSDFNEVRAADMDSFTDAELLNIYNDLIDRINRIDVYGIGIDGMRSILSASELQIMSEQTAESLYDNEVLDLYEQLCEHENDTDGTWFAEMRELYGLTSESSDDYILPDSDSRYYTVDELSGLSTSDLRIARNEIYARHGRIFDSADLDEYFRSKSWYTPSIPASQFSDSLLNDYEKTNAKTIQSVENGGSSSSSGFDGSSIYGTYTRHDSNRGIDYNVEIGFYTDPAYDYIHFSTPYHSGDNIYTGRLDQLDGNVYQATESGEFLRVTFLSNGDITVEIIKDNGGILDQLVGTYSVVSKTDLSHVG